MLTYMDIEGCPYGIGGWSAASGLSSIATGATTYIVGQVDFEDQVAQYAPVAHIYDPSSQIVGRLTHYRWNGGPTPSLVVNGAQNVKLTAYNPAASIAPYIQTFTSSDVWTKAPGVARVRVAAIGGGAGGASGATVASGTPTGNAFGGGAGGYSAGDFAAADLPSSISVTIGAGGSGGAAVLTPNSSGNTPKVGSPTTFGSFLTAAGGSGAALAGWGTVQNGAPATVVPAGVVGVAGPNGAAGMSGAGGAGGAISAAPGFTAGGFGGGGSGSVVGGGGNGGSDGNAGAAGGATAAVNSVVGGGGGGGGCSSVLANGGQGGSGGGYGSGGGGGGAALNGHSSGAGGNGAPGILVVTSW